MNLYFTDLVQITPVTRDASFRTETKGTSFSKNAYVEFDDRISYDGSGLPIRPAKVIFLPYATTIKEGDYIKVLKYHGNSVTANEQRVRSVAPVGSFHGSHLEILI